MRTLRQIAARIDDALDHARMRLRAIVGRDDPLTLIGFRGYGRRNRIFVSGHVNTRDPDDRGLPGDAPEEAGPGGSLIVDIRRTLARYVERGVMGATVEIAVEGTPARAVAETDSDGFFEAWLDVAPEETDWREVTLRLVAAPGYSGPETEARVDVLTPAASVDFGLISDVDDTVLRTGINDFASNWRTVIESDPRRRDAFPGLPELYRGIADGGESRRPIFYVSSASRGFYELFDRFAQHRGVPPGPFFLKNYGLDQDKWFAGGHSGHKLSAIEAVFRTYPDLPFILVGDSGQHDAMIYRDVVARYPERVLAVWIRDVSGGSEPAREIEDLLTEVARGGVPAILCPNLLVAAREAKAKHWIGEDVLSEVEASVRAAEGDA